MRRRGDALPAPGCLSSPCRVLGQWHGARCCPTTWALPVQLDPGLARCTSSCHLLQASTKTPGHLRNYCRSRCCSLHASSFRHLYTAPLDPPFLELTPSPALFPGQKGQLRSVSLRCVCCCLQGLRMGSGCRVLPPGYPRHWMPLQPAKSPCSQQPLPMLSQKTATVPFISGCIDPTKLSLYLRLSPPCSVLALAAGSCFLLVPKEEKA